MVYKLYRTELNEAHNVFSSFEFLRVAFLPNATVGYLSLCVSVCVSVFSGFCAITQKEIDLGT